MRIKLMGSTQVLRGHVGSLARGIEVLNAQPDAAGLAKVNPIFTWVRLAQRVPVRIHIGSRVLSVRFSFVLGTIVAKKKRIRCFGKRGASQWQASYVVAGIGIQNSTGKV